MFNEKHIYSVLNDDHDCLYRGLQNLKKMVIDGDDRESIINVLRLITYEFSSHFYREEELMETYKFHDLKHHRYTHSLLMQTLQTIVSNMTHDNYTLRASDIAHIDNILTSHIATDDMPLETFMSKIKKPENEDDLFAKISFSHRAVLWAKMKLSHIKTASKVFILSQKRPPQNGFAVAPKKAGQRTQHERNKTYYGWYYGNS